MLPLDGDPLKNTNLIAHPSGKRGSGKASALAVSNDGRYVFTAGGPDTCVHMWGVNPKVLPLPSDPLATAHFLLCMSEERLSLVMLPLDGDPLKNTNLIAHPSGKRGSGKASALAVSNDGRYVFTAGGPDTCVHMWGVNPKILEDRVRNARDVKRRFYDLLSPVFLNDLKDYYYYSMLRTQGLKCLDTRQTSLTIPITEISYVMRAVGFYPTEEEVGAICEYGT
ncbi:uncharacterized protein DEA37_0003712 [Paragonimus westermani]|uniref:Cilia- and flagella-associated protein 251 n=1 Tax=Paragonimus westermani TaxID=34504 RepID=A0A5J4NGH0_9TREM|nr:uncharacterized protein DEA37_0003712 [Paragonimus westermani]